MDMSNRILGLDVARAYAIFGMLIVNFNFCFGFLQDQSAPGRFLSLFVGNSTAIFIICAGMGVSLLTHRYSSYSKEEKASYKSVILKRSWFLFAIGLLLYNWWPGDILHFYGGYMHIAAFLIFLPKRFFLISAVAVIAIYHILLLYIPVDTGLNLATFDYTDFWTIPGFLRNTLYNGWNSIFPWFAYFALGMWLGRLDWQAPKLKGRLFGTALVLFLAFECLRRFSLMYPFERPVMDYLHSEYFPPYLPFMVITATFGVMIITFCTWLGERWPDSRVLQWLSDTGKMTLTNYVQHLTLGIVVLQWLSGINYTGLLPTDKVLPPAYILLYATLYFILSVVFSVLWTKKFKRGPLEMLMRRISNG